MESQNSKGSVHFLDVDVSIQKNKIKIVWSLKFTNTTGRFIPFHSYSRLHLKKSHYHIFARLQKLWKLITFTPYDEIQTFYKYFWHKYCVVTLQRRIVE